MSNFGGYEINEVQAKIRTWVFKSQKITWTLRSTTPPPPFECIISILPVSNNVLKNLGQVLAPPFPDKFQFSILCSVNNLLKATGKRSSSPVTKISPHRQGVNLLAIQQLFFMSSTRKHTRVSHGLRALVGRSGPGLCLTPPPPPQCQGNE